MLPAYFCFFFFNDTATTEIYTLSLHDALPIYVFCHGRGRIQPCRFFVGDGMIILKQFGKIRSATARSEEHTSELQSPCNLVCRLLLEKKKTTTYVVDKLTPAPLRARHSIFSRR